MKKYRKTAKIFKSAQCQYESTLPPPPSCIGTLLPQIMAKYGFQRQISSEKLVNAWKSALGDNFFDKTKIGSKKRGVLEIAVSHNLLVQELSFRTTELLAKLKSLVPEEKITRLRFVVGQF